MSRIGKKPVQIEKDIKVKIQDSKIDIEGPKGKLSFNIPLSIFITIRHH